MCTVTAIATSTGLILTSSRDEITSRLTAPPRVFQIESGAQIMYPADILANGTWIAMDDRGGIRCLLNGAHERHERRLPYRKSRGLVVTESFQYRSATDFVRHYDAHGIEPFTLIWVDPEQNLQADVIRWDHSKFEHAVEDLSQPRMWQSATLYTREVQRLRRTWFQTWLQAYHEQEDFNIQEFHNLKGSGDETHDIRMLRGALQTVSITQIRSEKRQLLMHYEDLISGTGHRSHFKISTATASN